jgi:hypothetical protein
MRGKVWETHAIFFDLDVEAAVDAESSVHYKQTVAMFHFGDGGMPAFSLERRGSDSARRRFQRPSRETPRRPARHPGVLEQVPTQR